MYTKQEEGGGGGMNATVLDLRKNMKNILAALDRNEKITLTYRGHKKAVLVPEQSSVTTMSVSDHSAFGSWAGRKDLRDVNKFIRNLRKDRTHAF